MIATTTLLEDRGPKPGQRLLRDSMPLKLQLVEDSQGGKLIVRGEFARCGRATENKRVYPEALWTREIEKLSRAMQERRLYGELDHPKDGRTELARTSHLITGLTIADGVIIGEAEVVDTARGRDVAALLRAGCLVGVSSRGYGSTRTNENGEEVVQDDYTLVTFDFVAEPADSTAYPTVFSEHKETGMSIEAQRAEDAVKARAFAARVEGEIAANQARTNARVESQVMDKDSEILRLHAALKERDLQLKTQGEQLEKVGALARSAGYKFYLERALAGDPDRDSIISSLGDLQKFESAEAFKSRVQELAGEFRKRRTEQAATQQVVQAQTAEQKKTEAALAAKVENLTKALEKSLQANKTLALQLYTERRVSGYPNSRQLVSLIESKNPASQADVETLIQEHAHKPRAVSADSEALAAARARARRATQGGVSSAPLNEEAPRQQASRSQSLEENYNGVGTDLRTIQQLSGIKGSPVGGPRSLRR